jgi:hypothetical protein
MTKSSAPLDVLIDEVSRIIHRSTEVIDNARNLITKPDFSTFELSWFETLFAETARRTVFNRLLNDLNVLKEGTVKYNIQWIMNNHLSNVINGAKFPPSSTSVCSNLCKTYEVAAHAEVVELLRHFQ